MILTAHQPAYLPWLGLFHKVALADAFVLLDNVQFENGSFTNRNKVNTEKGPVWLTVPVKLQGHTQKAIKEIEIDDTHDWQRKHWKTIYFNYKNTPYFDRYAPFLEEVYATEWRWLVDLTEHMFHFFLGELAIDVTYHRASDLNPSGRKLELVLELCEKLEADTYVFGAQVHNYLDPARFAQKGVRYIIQEYEHPRYTQQFNVFEPYMGIIDLLCNEGPERAKEIVIAGNITKQDIEAA